MVKYKILNRKMKPSRHKKSTVCCLWVTILEIHCLIGIIVIMLICFDKIKCNAAEKKMLNIDPGISISKDIKSLALHFKELSPLILAFKVNASVKHFYTIANSAADSLVIVLLS